MTESLTMIGAVVPLFAIISAGLVARRLGWLTEEADRSLLRLAVNLLLPALIFSSILGNAALRRTENLLLPPLIGFVTVAVGIFVASLASRFSGSRTEQERRTFAFTAGLHNYVYFALPLCVLLFDSNTAGVLLVQNVGVEAALWTIGVATVSGKGMSGSWSKLFNAPLIAVLLAVTLNLMGTHLALGGVTLAFGRMILTAIQLLGQCAVPLALLLTGAIVADHLAEVRGARSIQVVFSAILVRLGIMPMLFMLLAKYLPCPVELKRVIVIEGAMPSAILPVVLAKHYGGEPHIAIKVVLGTTVAGFVLIPVWIQFGSYFAGLSNH